MRMDATVLQIDVGNSGLKWRLVNAGHILARGQLGFDDAGVAQLPVLDSAPDAVAIASVAADAMDRQLAVRIRQQWSLQPWFARSAAETLGLRSSYANPETMGVDRWLAMLGAWHPLQERVCVVDVGSALTIDLVAEDGRHEGGYIVPGGSLMQRALLRDTQRVRFAESLAVGLEPGSSTAEAVSHGAAIAQCGAVAQAMVLAASGAGVSPRLLITGGGGEALARQLGMEAELRPDLVFEGLQLAAAAAQASTAG